MTVPGPRSDSGFRRLGERTVHHGSTIRLVEGDFETPEGEVVAREIVRHPGAVAVVPVDGDDVVLVRQYRAAVEEDVLEIPAGKRDVEGEPPEVAARRELQEEVGLVAATLTPLARFYNSIGFSDEYTHLFLATELTVVETDRQGPEEAHMTVERIPLDRISTAIADGTIEDGKTTLGLLAALRHLGR